MIPAHRRELDVQLGAVRVEVWHRGEGRGFAVLELERCPPPTQGWRVIEPPATVLPDRDDALRLAAALVAWRLGYPL